MPCLPVLPLSVSHSELLAEQQADPSLKELFGSLLSSGEMNSVSGYLIQNGILVKKWVSRVNDFVGDPIFQVVIPSKFRDHVLKLAHDSSGLMGVRKGFVALFLAPSEERHVCVHQELSHMSANW